jgi:hypothetical protein
MANSSKLTADERVVRKRLAARLRQRRCRERKRVTMIKGGATAAGSSAPKDTASDFRGSATDFSKDPLMNASLTDPLLGNYSHMQAYPLHAGSAPMHGAHAAPWSLSQYSFPSAYNPAMEHPAIMDLPQQPVTVSRNNSITGAPSLVADVPLEPAPNALGTKEAAAIDAMLSLGSKNDSSDADDTNSTASISSTDSCADVRPNKKAEQQQQAQWDVTPHFAAV